MKKIYLVLLVFLYSAVAAFAQVDLQKPFEDCGITGSITIYDKKQKKWTFSDEKDARRETLPASTFKIINSMIALDNGAVKNEKEVINWDGKKREVAVWNADTDLENAFKNSTVWFYVELAKRVGHDKYGPILKRSKYGNGKIDNGAENGDFWNYGDFGISPKEQIKFLRRFDDEDLPFSERSFDIVKRIMINETTENYTLRGKTGLTNHDGYDIGWYVGYVTRKDNTYYFATRLTKKLDTENPRFSPCRKEITTKVLRGMNIID